MLHKLKLILLILTIGLYGCGLKGLLYFPPEKETNKIN